MYKICVIGMGYIGLPTATMFALSGCEVVGVDINQRVVELVNQGKIHIEEPGLNQVVKLVVNSKKLKASTKPMKSDVFIIAVPTPINQDKTANLEYVKEAIRSILPFIQKNNIIIIESTISPLTTSKIISPILAESGLIVGEEIFLAHCPERVLPGQIMKELVENDRIIGGINEISAQKAVEVYKIFVRGKLVLTDSTTAEMSKLMENTFRDVNIALANELVKISNNLGINAHEVITLANRHPRVNIHQPGPGVGGHCLAVDPYFIVEACPVEAKLIASAREINCSMPNYVVTQISALVEKGDKVAILGVAYKGNIDDTRESPAERVIELLIEKGYLIGIYDPYVHSYKYEMLSLEDALKNAACAVILTDHKEFGNLDSKVFGNMKNPLILDTKNNLNELEFVEVRKLGFLPNKYSDNLINISEVG